MVDGGRPVESYLIFAQEESFENAAIDPAHGIDKLRTAAAAGHDGEEPPEWAAAPLCVVPAAATTRDAGPPMVGGQCVCDVGVEPNRAYAFSVACSNGFRRSAL